MICCNRCNESLLASPDAASFLNPTSMAPRCQGVSGMVSIIDSLVTHTTMAHGTAESCPPVYVSLVPPTASTRVVMGLGDE